MDPRACYEELVDDLLARHGDAERTQMMGMPSVKRNGKLVLGFPRREDGMVFKLPDTGARERALALGGAHLFHPGDPDGRTVFREWVVVPAAHTAEWERLAEAALGG
jgi:hypothetical protein